MSSTTRWCAIEGQQNWPVSHFGRQSVSAHIFQTRSLYCAYLREMCYISNCDLHWFLIHEIGCILDVLLMSFPQPYGKWDGLVCRVGCTSERLLLVYTCDRPDAWLSLFRASQNNWSLILWVSILVSMVHERGPLSRSSNLFWTNDGEQSVWCKLCNS